MNVIALTLVASACNVGTIACIKKCKHALTHGGSVVLWLLGIALTILATQYLLLWADVKGVSLGLAIAFVITSVMIAAAFLEVVPETGRIIFQSVGSMSKLALAGYGLAILGVMLVGLSQQQGN